MTTSIYDLERVHDTTANIEASGIILNQWAFSTDDLRMLLNDPSFKPQTESRAVQKDMLWDATGGCSESGSGTPARSVRSAAA